MPRTFVSCVNIYYACFYHLGDVKSRVFLHHFMAAVENLDPGERYATFCDLVNVCCPYLSLLKRTDLVHTVHSTCESGLE